MCNVFICLEKEVFKGNVLDITYNSTNIIYNANKYYDNSIEINYIEKNGEEPNKVEEIYDTCVLFFCLNLIKSNREIEIILDDIDSKLKKGGYLYIWDVTQKYPETKVTVLMPDKSIEKFSISSPRLVIKDKMDTIVEIIEKNFSIEEKIVSDGAYKLVCRKL